MATPRRVRDREEEKTQEYSHSQLQSQSQSGAQPQSQSQRQRDDRAYHNTWDEGSVTAINPPGLEPGEDTPWQLTPAAGIATRASTPRAPSPWRTAAPAPTPATPARTEPGRKEPGRKEPGRKEPGRLIGRYAMYEEIARGGMASVHLGRSVEPGTQCAVAIKRLFPQLASNPNFIAMFLDEGRLAARVSHPNVVTPLDFVVRAAEGELYLVMEYIHGESLAHLLTRSVRQGHAPSTDVAVGIMVGVLRGLHAAHEATTEDGTSLDIVHRDISPQNIVVGADGVARVVDFGVAKATLQDLPMDDDERPGKPSYLAPEQIRSGDIDRRSDVFSAGVVLWELLARRRLFRHGNPHVVAMKILAGDVPPPSHFNPDVSTALDAAVLKAMERKRERRYPTARSFADAILAATPPADAATISAWVEQVSGDILGLRAERVAEIMAGPRRSSPLRWRSLFGSELRWRQLITPSPRRRDVGTPSRPAWLPWGVGVLAVALSGMAVSSSGPQRAGTTEGSRPLPLVAVAALPAMIEALPATKTARPPVEPPAAVPTAPVVPVVPGPALPGSEPDPDDETDVEPDTQPDIQPLMDAPPANENDLVPHRQRARLADAPAVPSRPATARATALAAIEDLNCRAFASYRRAQYVAAHRLLRAALATAAGARLNRHPVTAITRTHLGAVLVVGFRQPELAIEQFRNALLIDPGISLSPARHKPEVAAAFRQAAART